MTVGVVMSGRGLHGLLNLAMVSWLEAHHIHVDHVVSTGTGSIIAALWGQHTPLPRLHDVVLHTILDLFNAKLDWYTFLTFFVSPFRRFNMQHALFQPHRLLNWMQAAFSQNTIESLRPHTQIVTTDVTTGTTLLLEHGDLASAVYASSALLPLFPPIQREGRWLNDGSFTDPLPIMPLINQHVGVILALQFESHPSTLEHTNRGAQTFLDRYTDFIGQSVPKSQKSKVAMALELHRGEIIFIKVKLPPSPLDKPDVFLEALETTRQTIQQHHDHIQDTISSIT